MLEKLEKAPNSTSNAKRRGRGQGSTLGKTCGKGQKGQKSRGCGKVPIGFEGGQMPLQRRLPKRGFTNIFKKRYNIVNLSDILGSKMLDLSQPIEYETLFKAGLINKKNQPVKVLGKGELKDALHIKADKFSAKALKTITDAGGKADIVVVKPND